MRALLGMVAEVLGQPDLHKKGGIFNLVFNMPKSIPKSLTCI